MTDKQIIIDGVDVSGCNYYQYSMCTATKDNYGDCSFYCKDYEMNYCYYKQLKRKEQECEELRQYHNKCCIEFENEKQELLERYNQVSRDFYNGKYCNKENCSLLKAKEQECEEFKKELEVIYDDCKGCPTCNEALYNANLYAKEYRKLKQTLAEIIRFFEEDEDFARYSGRPIIFAKSALEKIEKILKENDIKISEYKGKHNGKIGKTIT